MPRLKIRNLFGNMNLLGTNNKALPKHVVIVMDGNGRWARSKGLNRLKGHQAGTKTVKTIVAYARKNGIKNLSSFTFKIKNKPASIGAGYGWSNQALALGMPKHRLAAVLNVSIWRDTVESLEFRHDIDYATMNQGSGINAAVPTRGTGRSSNTITAQLGIYF